MKRLYIKIALSITYSVAAMEPSDSNIHSVIDNHISEVVVKMFCREDPLRGKLPELRVYQPDWLKNHVIKIDESRLKGAKKINDALKKLDNKSFFVPYKEEYLIPQEERKKTKRWVPESLVIAKKVIQDEQKRINLEQAKELKLLIVEAKYIDLNTGNLIPTADGIAICDTERRSFHSNDASSLDVLRSGLDSLANNFLLDDEAKKYVENELSAVCSLKNKK
ncbi:hypothetical protein HYX58_02540 [Candidatus Dependentiae bacterium]|nr:hypothetical protein [Candidatus Dependentiae bacterium]